MALTLLKEGSMAPDFTLPSSEGSDVSLAELKGNYVVLYFYPKDDTPGCTTEACGIRDSWDEIKATGAKLFGISGDPMTAHARFIKKFNLPFPLLSDAEFEVSEKYGTYGEKSMYGRRYMGVHRVTYIIDPTGKISKVYPKVKPEEHAADIVKFLKEPNGVSSAV